MNRIEQFTVYDGYTIEERCSELSLEKGRALMATRARRKIISVQKDESTDTIILNKQYLRCPSCGGAITATARYVIEVTSTGHIRYLSHTAAQDASLSEIENYLSEQYSLFSNEPLQVNRVVSPNRIRCTHCEAVVKKASKCYPVTIITDRDNRRVTLDVHKSGPDNVLFNTLITCKASVKPLKSYTERVTFDCNTGNVCWQLLDEESVPVLRADCTYDISIWSGLDSYGLINSNYKVKCKLTRAFRNVLGTCPVNSSNMTSRNAVLTTLFVGYPLSFFNRIPGNENNIIDRRFIPISQKMHLADDLPKLFEASQLPQKRCVRKLFFTTPELFWFIEECEDLSLALKNNVDLFVNVLSSENRFHLLSDMFTYHIKPFLLDYASVRTPKELAHLLIGRWESVRNYAKEYGVCKRSSQIEQQQEWIAEGTDVFCNHTSFQIPYSVADYSVVDGYEFVHLKKPRQLKQAASHLKNCLQTYSKRGKIYGVRRNMHYVAAMELVEHSVSAFLGFNNTIIPYDSQLYRAFKHWMEMNKLHIEFFSDDEDEWYDNELEYEDPE